MICKECRARGCTPKDPELYECKQCKRAQGKKFFAVGVLKHFKYNNRENLFCMSCQEDAVTVDVLKHFWYNGFLKLKSPF